MPWLHTQPDLFTIMNHPQRSVAAGWNQALSWLFTPRWQDGSTPIGSRVEYALVCNNDVLLRPDTYRHLAADGGGFVTAVGTRDPEKIAARKWESVPPDIREYPFLDYPAPDPANKRPHPDFSCYLIRRETWEKVGPFDENYKRAFVEDQDYHVRLHKAGIRAECLDLPFLHYGSMTIKNAECEEQQEISAQAAANRTYFQEKWGFAGGSPEYYALFGNAAPVERAP